LTEDTKARVLIVDDELAHMRALCDTLEDHGFEAVGCGNGTAALEALRLARFDLLLTDLMMPGLSGIELLRAALLIDPNLVGIIMTGEGSIGSAVDAMQAGALDYILKPFKVSAILPVLRRGLTVRRLQVENSALEARSRSYLAELELNNRELEAFTRSASHDLKAPLNGILGLSTLLLDTLGPQLSEEHLAWLNQIRRSAQSMNVLIEALMRLSRIGRQTLDLRPVDMTALPSAAVAEVLRAHPQRDISVQIDPLPRAVGDASLLTQVYVNLLSNAVKFTRPRQHPVIEVGSTVQADEKVYFVRDNGVGFDPAKADRLFDAFERLHSQESFEGSGVGLSIVQRIVQRHGGRIWAESAPDKGACFYFTLGSAGHPAGHPSATQHSAQHH
jgi:signal transduction histidine kinase